MPLLNEGTRFLVDTLKDRINEVVFGFDGTLATQQDGGIGNPAVVVTPNVKVIDDNTLMVEARVPLSTTFTRPLRGSSSAIKIRAIQRTQRTSCATRTTRLRRPTTMRFSFLH